MNFNNKSKLFILSYSYYQKARFVIAKVSSLLGGTSYRKFLLNEHIKAFETAKNNSALVMTAPEDENDLISVLELAEKYGIEVIAQMPENWSKERQNKFKALYEYRKSPTNATTGEIPPETYA